MREQPPLKKILTRAGESPDLPGVPALLRRVYGNRGVQDSADVDLRLAGLARPDGLPDLEQAADRIVAAVTAGQRILFVGDYDADGATAAALGVSFLRACGHESVDFLVPNRFDFGYGLSPEIVRLAAQRYPDLLITVDNGVSSIAGVAQANDCGLDVIVTDHHLPAAQRPDALALVNPNLPESRFPSKALAGVGVIFYVLAVCCRKLRAAGWFSDQRPAPSAADWLDLVALGTVADVVPLDQNNRRLVHHGLKKMRGDNCRPGMRALARVSKRDPRFLQASDLGFALSPRLNAAGRLTDMSVGIQCLLAESLAEAEPLAEQLDALNRQRRGLEQDMVAEAELLAADRLADGDLAVGLTLYDSSWHQGLVGLIAARIRERHHRPVIAFADAGRELKGSARSIPGLHVRDALDAIAARNPGLVEKFGGHATAAGLSLNPRYLKRFAAAFDDEVRTRIGPDALEPSLTTDGELAPEDLTLGSAEHLANAGPWGQGFPEPLFHGEFDLISQRVVGEAHLRVSLRADGRLISGIAFRQPPLPACDRVRAVYALEVERYREPTLQLRLEQITPA